jgi:NADP-dependent 3-hydroxy acid dehydrogenase YdfG
MIITGNNTTGVAGALAKLYPDAEFCSRTTGFDLSLREDQVRVAQQVLEHDVFINCAALFKFHQTNLLDEVYKLCVENKHRPHIINIGSTTDRVKNGKAWRYNAEKKALRDYSNTLGISGVWGITPKITYISFGTLSNNTMKHPQRICMDIDKAAEYIKWVIEQPKDIAINEISIDPMQDDFWSNDE